MESARQLAKVMAANNIGLGESEEPLHFIPSCLVQYIGSNKKHY